MKFAELPEFSRELKRLAKKYRSLKDDLASFKPYLAAQPCGNGGRHWNCLYKNETVAVYKTRLACAYLRASDMRLIYAYHPAEKRVIFIEVYYKGKQENESRERIRRYVKIHNMPD